MKLLTVGDLHYNVRQFDWVLANAARYDMIIIVGDLLNIAGHVDLDTQILVVRKYLQRLREKTTLLVCSGNHDGDRKSPEGEFFADWLEAAVLDTIHGDGASFTAGAWRFSVCPWWDGPIGREKVDTFLNAEAAGAGDNWFVIHHAPPSGTRPAWTGKRDFGDSHLREFITAHQPRVVLSGHIHNAPFRQEDGWHDRIGRTWIFNAGYQMGELPPCLVFDLENNTVEWASLAGQESVAL
jgi:Icc-related predicted phosphoesterase